jgi:hypothetical protein
MFNFGKRRHKVRVFVQEGPTLEGFLRHVGVFYVLDYPAIIEDGSEPVSLDGPVEVPRERVLFFQVIE